nr:EOG090X0BMA [Eurycercus lamellatus]
MSLNNNKFDALNNSEGDSDDDETSFSEDKKRKDVTLQPIVVPPGEHPLQFTYCLWFSRRAPGKHAAPQSFDQNLKMVGRFASVEQFWSYYCHLVRPCELTGHSDFHLFKDGIKPMWEDDANRWGGKWIVRLRKGLASRCWENLILAMLGEQFMEDIISVWNRLASDQATTNRIRDTLRRVLNLPPNTILEYKNHTDSLKYGMVAPPFK